MLCVCGSVKPSVPRRRPVRASDVKRAIKYAQDLCYNYENTDQCRAAWSVVEELSEELARSEPREQRLER